MKDINSKLPFISSYVLTSLLVYGNENVNNLNKEDLGIRVKNEWWVIVYTKVGQEKVLLVFSLFNLGDELVNPGDKAQDGSDEE